MRSISNVFINDLQSGLLNPVLNRVKQDHTLMLAIRKNYINIYYRGGNILKISEKSPGSYSCSFEKKYNKSGRDLPVLPNSIKSEADAFTWVAAFPHLKELMDLFFSKYCKPEREFQQLVTRENNFSTISNQSEYFISDIEFADSAIGARFDLLAIRWDAPGRKNGRKCKAVLIEMKYGDGALGGRSGLYEHLRDIDTLISNPDKYKQLLETIESQISQLGQLGMLKLNQSSMEIKLNLVEKPEVLFLLANHNPRSTKLSSLLDRSEVAAYEANQRFDLRFFVSSFAGYALHSSCMMRLAQFRTLLKSETQTD